MSFAARRLPLCAAMLWLATPALAQDDDEPAKRAAPVQKIYDCRAIGDDAARLACFDASVADLAAAEEKREVSFADKETIKKTRRGLFGFSLPRIGLFGGDSEDEEINEIEATVKSASIDRSGKYRMVMQDGAVWQQIDTTRLPRDPKPGHIVKIKVASLGSYFANVDGQRAIRLKRDR
ncbi:MAG: hypothetical protein H2056_03695 [Sphingopyxis sp.]|nr:hypothetical protein [Sphingopyxis sp.]